MRPAHLHAEQLCTAHAPPLLCLQLPRVYFSLSGYLAKVPPQKSVGMVRAWKWGPVLAAGAPSTKRRWMLGA